jgi:hypothetical protein
LIHKINSYDALLEFTEAYDFTIDIDDGKRIAYANYDFPIYIMVVSLERRTAYVNVLTCEDIQLLKDAIGVNNEEV